MPPFMGVSGKKNTFRKKVGTEGVYICAWTKRALCYHGWGRLRSKEADTGRRTLEGNRGTAHLKIEEREQLKNRREGCSRSL